MGCYSEDNIVLYSDDIQYCRNTYNYSLGYGTYIKVKTLVIDNQIPVDEELCISFGAWTGGIQGNPPQYNSYYRIHVNNINIYNLATKSYAIGNKSYILKNGDIIDLYAKTPYAWDNACVNNFRISAYNPCEGVVCDDYCDYVNHIKYYNGQCVDGQCIYDIEKNSIECGYIPPDPCEGIICDNICAEQDLYSQKCVDGICVEDELIEENSEICGYKNDNWLYWIIGAGILYTSVKKNKG